MPTYSIDGPDGKTYSVDGPVGATREQVIAQITKQLGQAPAPSTAWETAKDVGRGVVHGLARAVEYPPTVAVPSLIGKFGHYLETPEETAERDERRRAIEQVRAEAGSPTSFVGRFVAPPQTPAGEATQSVFELASSAPLQPGGLITKGVTTLGIGLGGYGGEKTAEELGLPPWLGHLFGGVAGGVVTGGGAQLTAERRAQSMLPTAEQNRQASKEAIRLVQQGGLVIEPTEVQQFAAGLRADLDRNLFSPQPGGRGNVAYHAADLIEQTNGDLATLLNVHSTLGTITPGEGANYAAALQTRDQIREWIANLLPSQVVHGDPQAISDFWQFHREAWRIHSNLEDIDNALNSAEWRRMVSGRGTNLNVIRQEVRKILENDNKARRYSPEAREQMERVIEGDLARNIMRRIAGFAPHGPVSAIPAIAATAVEGTGVGAAVAATGFIAHMFSGVLEQRSVRQLQDIIGAGSPLLDPARRRARARLLEHGRAGVAAARGVLAPGAQSPLAPESPQE